MNPSERILPGHIMEPVNPFEADEQLIAAADAIASGSGSSGKQKKGKSTNDGVKIVWKCASLGCNMDCKVWKKKDNNRWIVCDNKMCSKAFHLQCASIDYDDDDYYYLDVENLPFLCEDCRDPEDSDIEVD